MNRTLFFLAIALLVLPHPVGAGAWVQPEGATFVSIKTLMTTTDRYFDDTGSVHRRGGDFTKYELETYVEHGLTAEDTLMAKLPLQRLTDSATDAASAGVADLEVGWRRRLWHNTTTVVSGQLLALLPTGYSLSNAPALGYGRLGLEPSFLLGRSFSLAGRPGYVESQLGLRCYAGYPSEQVRAMVGGGFSLLPWFSPFATVEVHYGLGNGEDRHAGGQTIVGDYRLLKGTFGAILPMTDTLAWTAAWQQHLWGERTGYDGGVYVGLWLRF